MVFEAGVPGGTRTQVFAIGGQIVTDPALVIAGKTSLRLRNGWRRPLRATSAWTINLPRVSPIIGM